jgi:hypothetical protein
MATRKQTITLGIAVASAILAMFVPILIAVLLFVLAALLIAWGLQPKRTEESIGRLPYGSILKALAKLDSMLSKLDRVTEEQLDEQKMLSRPTIKIIKHRSLLLRSLVSWR